MLPAVPFGDSRRIVLPVLFLLHQAAMDKAGDVVEKLKAMRLAAAANLVSDSIHETLGYYAFPSQHWMPIRWTEASISSPITFPTFGV